MCERAEPRYLESSGVNGDERMKLHTKRQDRLFYGLSALLGLLIFLTVGSRTPVLFDDSASYLNVGYAEGVMPLYQLFLFGNQCLFGDAAYLQIVIIEQALLAVVGILVFVRVLEKKFALRYWECALFCALALMPFTTEMPGSLATQQILTEGVAYALFYLWSGVLLKTVWTKQYRWLCASLAMTLLLAMVRSQLQILFGVCGVVFLYLICRNRAKGGRLCFAARFISGCVGCIAIGLAGVAVTAALLGSYKRLCAVPAFRLFVLSVQSPLDQEEYLAGLEREKVGLPAVEYNAEDTDHLREKMFVPSQYVSLVFSRGMYEADPEDAALFKDEVVRGLYLELYRATDAQKQRYAYAQKGLWMWRDIVGGIGMVGKTCLAVPSEYYVQYYPDIILSDSFSDIRNEHLRTIGTQLLKRHFGRFLYHTLMLLPQAFVCTVFFQIAPIYLLCHLVTLFLYVSALALMIWGYADRKADDAAAESMALVLGGNLVMILVISLVFFGQQRYLVYNFGIFYMAYYLLLRQLWAVRIRERLAGRLPRFGRHTAIRQAAVDGAARGEQGKNRRGALCEGEEDET